MFETYFSSVPLLSKGCIWNAAFSDRSDGKTTDMKINTVLDYMKNGEISIVTRRFKTEMTTIFYENFLSLVFDKVDTLRNVTEEERDLIRDAKKYEYSYSPNGIRVRKSKNDEWDTMVFFQPLTMSGKKKSAYDSYYTRIHKIYFDEYIPLDGRYAQNEMELLAEFYKSVDRDRETTRMILYGNKIDLFNPFFDFFNISLDLSTQKVRTYRDNTLAVQVYVNKEHREKKKGGRLNSLFAGTDYEDYNNGGILTNILIPSDTIKHATYWGSFKSEQGEGSIWYNGNFVISTKKRKDGFIITDKIYDIQREQYTANFGKFGQNFRWYYRSGKLKFESKEAFHAFEPVLRLAGR